MNRIIACIIIPRIPFFNRFPLRFRSLESYICKRSAFIEHRNADTRYTVRNCYTCKRTAIIERTNNIEINLCFNDFIKSFSSKVFLAVYNSKTLF